MKLTKEEALRIARDNYKRVEQAFQREVERDAGAVSWTKEPPQESGWYWVKTNLGIEVVKVCCDTDSFAILLGQDMEIPLDHEDLNLWYPIPIEAPSGPDLTNGNRDEEAYGENLPVLSVDMNKTHY